MLTVAFDPLVMGEIGWRIRGWLEEVWPCLVELDLLWSMRSIADPEIFDDFFDTPFSGSFFGGSRFELDRLSLLAVAACLDGPPRGAADFDGGHLERTRS